MLSKTAFFILIIATIGLGTIFYLKECDCNKKATEVQVVTNTTTTEQPQKNVGLFAIDGEYSYNCNANILFGKSSAEHNSSINDCIKSGFENLKAYITNNPSSTVAIEGYALSGESNNSNFENLGLARAVNMKKYLMSIGFTADRIVTNGLTNDKLNNDEANIINPISIKVYSQAIAQSQVNNSVNNISSNKVEQANGQVFSTLTLNYDDRTTFIKVTDNDNKVFEEMLALLKQNQNAKVKIITHSDQQGSTVKNENMAQTRAEFVKDFFTKNKVESNRVFIENKGSTQAIADNTTDEGRATNRRMVISIFQ